MVEEAIRRVRQRDGNGYASRIELLEVGQRDTRADLEKLEGLITVGFEKLTLQIVTDRDKIRADIDAVRTKSATEIGNVKEKIAEDRQWNWPFLISAAGFSILLFSSMMTGFYFLANQNTQNLMQPLDLKLSIARQILDTFAQRLDRMDAIGREVDKALQVNASDDERSKQDRIDTRQRLDTVADNQGRFQAQIAALQSDSGEKNTQLCAIERVQNIVAAYQARLDGELWNETHETPLPPLPAFPVGLSCAPRS